MADFEANIVNEYGDTEFLRRKNSDGGTTVVSLDPHDHGVITIAEEGSQHTSRLIFFPWDIPVIIKALVAAHDSIAEVPYADKEVN